MSNKIDFLKKNLICLKCKSDNLKFSEDKITCTSCGYDYKIVSNIPILIDEDKNDSVYHLLNVRNPDININEKNEHGVYKYVEKYIKATSGYLYKIKNLKKYPIPNTEIDDLYLKDKNLLDIGCGWGRWTFSFSKKTKLSVGIDVSINALISANNVAEELNLNCLFLYADSRNLPFKDNTFDNVFSYSVLQHLSSFNLFRTLKSTHRVLKVNGFAKFQLMNTFALRNLYIQIKRGFRKPINFEVRYHNIKRLSKVFNKIFNDVQISNCSFFTQARIEDYSYLVLSGKIIIIFSFILNKIGKYLSFMSHVSENFYVSCKK